jgi:hypothetical protein
MDPILNPYAPGAGTPPPELAGRQDILYNAQVLFGRLAAGRSARSMILVGLRGVGKTVLLTQMRRIAESHGFRNIAIEAHEDKSLPELLIPPLQELLFALSTIESSKDYARRALRVLKGFVGSLKFTIEGVSYGLSIDPEPGVADSGDIEADLPRLLTVVAQAAQKAQIPVAIFIDEIQYLPERDFSAAIMGIHRIIQDQLPMVLVAAGLPQTRALAGNSKTYAERLFQFPEVGALQVEHARVAISKPADEKGVAFDEDALALILETTQRYPYFLQQWGYEAWNCAQGPNRITVSDVKRGHEMALSELDQSFFKVRFDRCTPAEKTYMRALAALGSGKQRSGEIADRLGLKVTSLGPTRNNLIRKGMIYSPAHGDTAFTVPLFDAFMKRVMPETK